MTLKDLRRVCRRPAFQLIAVLAVAMIGLIWFGIIFHLEKGKALVIESTRQNTENLARAFERQIIQIIDTTDKILLALQSEYDNNPEQFNIESARRYQGIWNEEYNVLDSNGILRATTMRSLSNESFDLSDRDYFRVHVNDDKAGLFISKPIVGRLTGKGALAFSRRLNHKDGSFAGTISALVYQDKISQFYQTIDLGGHGIILLIDADGTFLASGGFTSVSNPNSPARLLKKVEESSTGFFSTVGRVDGVHRLLSYRKLQSYPLIVAVGIAEDDAFANYQNERSTYFLAATLLTIIVLFALGIGVVRERKFVKTEIAKQRSEEELTRANQELIEKQALIEESRGHLLRAEKMAQLGHYKIANGSEIFEWSENVYRILGKSPETFSPTLSSVLELLHPDDRAIAQRYRDEAMSGIPTSPTTVRAFRNDGQMIYLEGTSELIRASDGTITGRFGTLQDVTVRKQAEDAIARTNEQLEKIVTERTAALQQEMRKREETQITLWQKQKMDAVGQLTAGIAHDFNNLLAVIAGGLEFVERAAKKGLPAEPELIDASLRASWRGRDLVQRLLAFSRQSPLKAEPVNADQLVLDTLRLLQRTLGAGVDIVTRLEATGAMVCVDRSQFATSLINLALNARDAMPEGGQLTIATSCQASSWAEEEGPARWPTGEEICITITDTGVGMTNDVRCRALEPFFTTKKDGLGSGLGLSMVDGFVEQTGGHIEIDSVVGRGTTIKIHLPRIEAVNQADEAHAMNALSAGGNAKTILLVEDDPDVRIMTTAQLKELGYSVHAVKNGNEAIDLIASPASIDIMLTDIVLPGGIDGVTLVKEGMRARPRIGVLCMSGYDPTKKNRKWLQVQNIEFLEKPFSSARLAQALDIVLAR